jgi:enoyl-CoA hydratase
MGLAKRVIDDGLGRPLADGLDLERDAFVEVFGTEDARTGVQSFLANGPGKAAFHGR